jgi:hypothetical protein
MLDQFVGVASRAAQSVAMIVAELTKDPDRYKLNLNHISIEAPEFAPNNMQPFIVDRFPVKALTTQQGITKIIGVSAGDKHGQN